MADALSRPHLQVEGFHSHIGSQIFEAAPFCDAVDICWTLPTPCARPMALWPEP